jgi:hypothetical protein
MREVLIRKISLREAEEAKGDALLSQTTVPSFTVAFLGTMMIWSRM